MIGIPPDHSHGDGNGIVWPDSGIDAPGAVTDVDGPRLFPPHIVTVGFDYDFHRGFDLLGDGGDPVHACQVGEVQRWHYTHFGWEADSQLLQWTEVDPAASVAFARVAPSTLRVTGSRVGVQTFPATAGRLDTVRERVQMTAGNWELRLNFADIPSTTGRFGFGVLDPDTDELIAMEYDGTGITLRGVDANGPMEEDGELDDEVGGVAWLRIRTGILGEEQGVFWEYSDDASSWTEVGSETLGVAWTSPVIPKFIPVMYWVSTDVDGTPDVIDVESFGWYDNQTIARFGNWVVIQNLDKRILCMHLREFTVEQGTDIRVAGEQVGTIGRTGFDTKSGPIQTDHIHLERIDSNQYSYSNLDPINPLAPGFMPRVDVSNNVSVVRTTANDPDGVASWKLAITVAREDQDFDLNLVSLTGDSATRTINFDTRAGLNANNDIPKEDGVYIVPAAFNEASADYVIDVFFNKSVVGTAFVSYVVENTAGTVLASE